MDVNSFLLLFTGSPYTTPLHSVKIEILFADSIFVGIDFFLIFKFDCDWPIFFLILKEIGNRKKGRRRYLVGVFDQWIR